MGSPRSDGTCEAKGKASGKQRKHDYVDNSACQTTVIPGEGYETKEFVSFQNETNVNEHFFPTKHCNTPERLIAEGPFWEELKHQNQTAGSGDSERF